MDSLQHLTLLAMPSILKWPIFLASWMALSPSFSSHFSGVLFYVCYVDSFLKSGCSLEFCPQAFLFLHYICPGWQAFSYHLFADVFQISPWAQILSSIPPRYPAAFRPLLLTSIAVLILYSPQKCPSRNFFKRKFDSISVLFLNLFPHRGNKISNTFT